MAEIQLVAKVSNIVKFERNTGLSLVTAFTQDNMSITVVVELVKALSGATDTQIDDYVKEHGFEGISEKLTEALREGGFLPKEEAKPAKA